MTHRHYCAITGEPDRYCCDAQCSVPCPDCPDESRQELHPLVMYIMRHFDDCVADPQERRYRAEAAKRDYDETCKAKPEGVGMSAHRGKLKGHALSSLGIWNGWPYKGYLRDSSAICECGAKSPQGLKTLARREWHRQHKGAVAAGAGREVKEGARDASGIGPHGPVSERFMRHYYGPIGSRERVDTPLDELPFPVRCAVCKAGPFRNAIEVDDHITEEHLPEAVWSYAHDNMRREL